MKRRTLIKAIGAAGIATTLPLQVMGAPGKKNMKVLFMGGTGFIGPHMVRALVAAGHEITLFNRGKTNAHLFPELSKIKGDRLTDDLKQLSGRQWDLIVDTSCYIPRAVDMLMDAVDTDQVKQYIFISTISVYASFTQAGITESSPLARMDEDPDSEDTSKWYGALKVRCEEQAEKAMPGRVTKVRCGLIVGPGDKTDRFTYWPVTAAKSDEMLAPGNGDDPLQTIDVRDLADWVVHCVNQKLVGPFNSTNPAGLYNFRDVLHMCRDELNPDLKLTWIPEDFLETQNLDEGGGLPLWVGGNTDYAGIWKVNSGLAASKGLKARPLNETIRDTWAWWLTLPEERTAKLKTGLSPERQAEILTAWRGVQSTG